MLNDFFETVDLQRGGGGVVKRSGSKTGIYIFIKYILFGPAPPPKKTWIGHWKNY